MLIVRKSGKTAYEAKSPGSRGLSDFAVSRNRIKESLADFDESGDFLFVFRRKKYM